MSNVTKTVPLLVRFGRLGDMVLQTPLLHLLHRRFGSPCRLLTSGPWSSELFAANHDVGEIWQLRARHVPFWLSPERWRLVGALRSHTGPVYVSEDTDRQIAKVRRLLALAGTPSGRCLFLTEQVARDGHWVDRLLRFGTLTPPAFRAEDSPASPRDAWHAPYLYLHPCDRADRDRWLHNRRFVGRPIVLLQPGNKRAIKWGHRRFEDPKSWPNSNWAELLREMRRRLPDACLLLCGSVTEARLLKEIRDAAGDIGVDIATEDLPVRRLLALMEIAHSMVAVDTGPAHMAAAVACPLVVLYGAESPRVWGRRSAAGSPVVEIGGPPDFERAGDIPLLRVVEAWIGLGARVGNIRRLGTHANASADEGMAVIEPRASA